ncbi:MAG: Transcriptional regulator, TrmB [uncultured bacterium]|uniref:Transcriptional regulator, TrmB n=1 Tax=Candidatus Wolfebacteria bacterium GW2011_GWE2_44_13 TaxID=1619017 RepID=A0A0G1H9K1_9BACT|nr:MAG: Transcriptional regulator, TrmB [uncultured bacterium]KKT43193.1 MAG: Transcriptional regulator, TrmB [Candidatus Wolfebacteria bacterium GW2011_GWE2_44_13]
MLSKKQFEEIRAGLLQLEFTDNEIAVYVSILQDRGSSIPSVAKETELSRGTVYDVVEKLKGKGFIAEAKKGKKRKFVAENPNNKLYLLLDEKHRDLQRSKQIVEQILPILNVFTEQDAFRPQVRVYEGEKGFRQIWDEVFSYEGKNFLSITRVETFLTFMGQEFLDELQERKAKLGITSRAINEDSAAGHRTQDSDKKYLRETRLAPKEFQFPSSEIIFGDNIAMFSTRKENIIVVIESKDLAEAHRTYFEMMWQFIGR